MQLDSSTHLNRANGTGPGADEVGRPYEPVDLLTDFEGLARLLLDELKLGSWRDSFLLAAGMNQVLEDYLHRALLPVARMVPRLSSLPGPWGRGLPTAALGLGLAANFLRDRNHRERQVLRLQGEVASLVQSLAMAAVEDDDDPRHGSPEAAPSGDDGRSHADISNRKEVSQRFTELLSQLEELASSVGHLIARHPTSFRSLDQQPADLDRIVHAFSERYPERTRPLLVVGVRTSGNYLAPLYSAYLRRSGYQQVSVITIRPGSPLLASERGQVQRLIEQDGLLLVADDPPKSGATLRNCVAGFERMGVSRSSILLLLPLLGEADSAPWWLASYPAIVLPFGEWAIQEQLTPPNLTATLRELLVGRTVKLSPSVRGANRITVGDVVSATPTPLPPLDDLSIGSPVRRHLRVLIRAQVREAGTDRRFEHHVYVKGVGFGYFGQHSRVVAESLAHFFPAFYGVRNGLLFRAWLPEQRRVGKPVDPGRLASRIGSYVSARSRALSVDVDLSERTGEVRRRVTRLVEPSFGRLALASRPLLSPVTRRLLRVDKPSVIDGSMSLAQWFEASAEDAEGPRELKVDYDERAFANQDAVVDELHCYDAIYDLAGAAVDHAIRDPKQSADSGFEDQLREAFEAESGRAVPDESWLLYQLMHATTHIAFLEEYLRESRADPAQVKPILDQEKVARETDTVRRAMAGFEHRYLGKLMLADAEVTSGGPLCAIDIDGVLETGTLGYSSSTPLGALCLRALARHGYCPVLVTGRSLAEVRDRCLAFRMPGAVAEYGAMVYDHEHRAVIELLTADEREALDRLRQALSRTLGVHVDAGYERVVRASIVRSGGRRKPLPMHLATTLLKHLGLDDAINVYPGYAQTDFMVRRVDKVLGLHTLAERLSGASESRTAQPLVFAIGDSQSDLPLLTVARQAFVPRNADRELREAGIEVMTGDCQVGLAQAVGRLLGHPPGGCPRCRMPRLENDARLLLDILSAQNVGRWAKPAHAAKLAIRLLNSRSGLASAPVRRR